jgi:hypothetical protein
VRPGRRGAAAQAAAQAAISTTLRLRSFTRRSAPRSPSRSLARRLGLERVTGVLLSLTADGGALGALGSAVNGGPVAATATPPPKAADPAQRPSDLLHGSPSSTRRSNSANYCPPGLTAFGRRLNACVVAGCDFAKDTFDGPQLKALRLDRRHLLCARHRTLTAGADVSTTHGNHDKSA